MKRKSKIQAINSILDIPKEIGELAPKVTIVSFDSVLIENFRGVLEYEEFYIRIKTEIGVININGFGMSLEQITEDDIRINGTIESIDIERTV